MPGILSILTDPEMRPCSSIECAFSAFRDLSALEGLWDLLCSLVELQALLRPCLWATRVGNVSQDPGLFWGLVRPCHTVSERPARKWW